MKQWFSLVFFCLPLMCSGATLLWQETFSDEDLALSTWITGGITQNQWVWTDDPCGIQVGPLQPCFGAASANNGYLYYNSSSNPAFHNVSLQYQQAIDISGASEVWVKFQNQYAYFNNSSEAFLGVSTDGVSFTDISILDNVFPNEVTDDLQNVVLDISSFVNGSNTVFLRFVWEGNNEYAWKVDDVEIWDENPLPINDLAIKNNFYSRAPNAFTPVSQRSDMFFLLDILNEGQDAQYNAQVLLRIEDLQNNSVVFSDTILIDSIPAGEVVQNLSFPNAFYPPNEVTDYLATYVVSAAPPDANPDDNEISFGFSISDSLFSKDFFTQIFSFFPPPSVVDWSYGNHYYLPNGAGYKLGNVHLEIANAIKTKNTTLNVYLYEWEDVNGDSDAQANERGVTPAQGGKILGQGFHEIVGNEFVEIIDLDVQNFDVPGAPIFFKDSTHYLLMVQYNPPFGQDEPIYIRAAPIDYLATWYGNEINGNPLYGAFYSSSGNLGANFVRNFDSAPVVRMELLPAIVPIKRVVENQVSLRVYPSPSKGVVNLQLPEGFDVGPLIIQVFSNLGELIYHDQLMKVDGNLIVLDIAHLNNGQYWIQIMGTMDRQILFTCPIQLYKE